MVRRLYEANPGDLVIKLSLAGLLMADVDHDGVVEVAAGVANDSDLGAPLLHLREAALFAPL